MKYAPMPVLVNGIRFDSAKDAAAATGVAVATIYSALAHGNTHNVGVGRGRHYSPRGGRPVVSVSIGPYVFPTSAQASLTLGFKRRYVDRAITGNKKSMKLKVLIEAMKWLAKVDAGKVQPPVFKQQPRKVRRQVAITIDWVEE